MHDLELAAVVFARKYGLTCCNIFTDYKTLMYFFHSERTEHAIEEVVGVIEKLR
jgi:hypothetical protein